MNNFGEWTSIFYMDVEVSIIGIGVFTENVYWNFKRAEVVNNNYKSKLTKKKKYKKCYSYI